MNDQSSVDERLDLFSLESTRSRWTWVHKAIALAKDRNEADLPPREAPRHLSIVKSESAGA